MSAMHWPVLALLVTLSLVIAVPRAKRGASSFTAAQSQFQKEALDEHNNLRKKHCVPPLVLDDTLSQSAQSYAENLAQLGKLQHSGGDYGENLFMMGSSAAISNVPGATPTDTWYKEIKDYDFTNPGFSSSTGHFTQVIWKATTNVGLGIAFSANGQQVYVVGQFTPAGNMENDYADNVLPATC